MIRIPLAATLVLALGVLGGCAKEESSPGVTTVTSGTQPAPANEIAPPSAVVAGANAPMAMGSYCPMAVAGTSVETMETPVGVNMIFRTNTDVPALRRRVHDMATHMSMMTPGGTRAGGMMTMMSEMPQVRAFVEDVEGGAQVEIAPVAPAKVDEVRQHVRRGAEMMMLQHDCPMMQTQK